MKRYEHWLPQPYDEALAETLGAKLNIAHVVRCIQRNRDLQPETGRGEFLDGTESCYYDD